QAGAARALSNAKRNAAIALVANLLRGLATVAARNDVSTFGAVACAATPEISETSARKLGSRRLASYWSARMASTTSGSITNASCGSASLAVSVDCIGYPHPMLIDPARIADFSRV